MEKNASLSLLDREMCDYHLRNNHTRSNNLFCYPTDKKHIAQFYTAMGQHFMRSHIDNPAPSARNRRLFRVQSHIQQSIRNPLVSGLPKKIDQNNVINVDTVDNVAVSKVPQFSQVESTKNKKYVIGKQVRAMITQDIKELLKQKEQALFHKKFPPPPKQARTMTVNGRQIEAMIKHFNRMMVKFSDTGMDIGCGLSMLDMERDFDEAVGATANINDQKYRILALFKKMYLQNNTEAVDASLMKYIMKFKNHEKGDKLSKKVSKARLVFGKQNAVVQKDVQKQPLSRKVSTLKLLSSKQVREERSTSSQCFKRSSQLASQANSRCKEKQRKIRIRTSHASRQLKLAV